MKEVTIIGRGDSWKECTFCTEELWGAETCLITEGLKDKKYTKVFSADDNEVVKQCLAIAKEKGIPFVSTRAFATEPYPLVDIVREFWSSYFMPTLSYALAYALYLKYDRIWIYGIDAGKRWDYQQGKNHMLFWLGVATGRKVDLRLGRGSLRWAYRMGLNEFPEAFFIDEEASIANHIGLDIRKDEIKELES